jgi:hypothetical protein
MMAPMMRTARSLGLLALLAACGGAPVPAAPLGHTAPAVQDAADVASGEEDCEDETEALTRGTIDIQICAKMAETGTRE